MNKNKKKQVFAFLIVFMFVGSSIAYGIIQAFPTGEESGGNFETDYIYLGILEPEQEANVMNNGVVLVKFFTKENCIACDSFDVLLKELTVDFRGYLFVEKIDIEKYGEHAESVDVSSAPTLILMGLEKTEYVTETQEYFGLFDKICEHYTYENPICNI